MVLPGVLDDATAASLNSIVHANNGVVSPAIQVSTITSSRWFAVILFLITDVCFGICACRLFLC